MRRCLAYIRENNTRTDIGSRMKSETDENRKKNTPGGLNSGCFFYRNIAVTKGCLNVQLPFDRAWTLDAAAAVTLISSNR
jgi:hypothetical protein